MPLVLGFLAPLPQMRREGSSRLLWKALKDSATVYFFTIILQTFIGRGTGALWFRYDLSPLTVKYTERGEPLFVFLTAVCAVVGGVFTVAGIIDALIFSGHELIRKKFQLGKQH